MEPTRGNFFFFLFINQVFITLQSEERKYILFLNNRKSCGFYSDWTAPYESGGWNLKFYL